MPPLATVVVVWAAVYGYVCIYYILLYARRRTDREYLTFGLVAGALCIYSAGNARVLQAETATDAADAMRLTWFGIIPCTAFFVDFCHKLIGRRSHIRWVAYLWAVLGVLAVVFESFIDPSEPRPPPAWGFPSAPDYQEATVRPLGRIHLVVGLIFASIALMRLVRPARVDRDVRLLLVSSCFALPAAANDILVRVGILRSWYLLAHTTMLAVLAMSYVLLDRFVRTSDQLRIRTDELSRSYRELQRTQRALVRKEQLAAMGELSAIIAHEVRNPIAVIKNAISGLRRKSLGSAERHTLLSILDEETHRLHHLVNDLRIYARPMVPDAHPLDIKRLIHESIEVAREARQPEDIQVEEDLSAAPRTLRGDAELLRQSIANIVDNAFQAMSAGGRLTVCGYDRTIDGRPAVCLEFTDTGEGMDTFVRDKARDPFFTTRASGTGLGLAIVDRVARAHGGAVEIDSRYGGGTSIRLILSDPGAPDAQDVDSPDHGAADSALPERS